MMDYDAFARDWENAWNSHDLTRILGRYADGIIFRSQKAAELVGSGVICGKGSLRDYWARALERQPDLHFRVQEVFHGHEMLVVTYLNQRGVLAAETLRFGVDGLVIEASACHKTA